MGTITAFEAKTRFGELLERVMAGEEIIITRHEKPVARIVPEGNPRLEDARRTVAALKVLQEEIASYSSNKKVPWEEFKSFVEEGRP